MTDLKKCEIVYQISKITVTASFSTSEILSDKFNIDVTDVVKDLFTLSDNIARIKNQFLIPHSPDYNKGQIDALLAEGKVVTYIAKSIGRSRKAIYNYINRSGFLNIPLKLKIIGRPSKFTCKEIRRIIRKTSKSVLSAGDIRDELDLNSSVRTIQRSLKACPYIERRKLKSKPFLSSTGSHGVARGKFEEEQKGDKYRIFYKNMKIGSQYFFVSNKDHVTTNSLDFIPFNDLFISTHSNSTSMGEHYIFVKSKLIERPTVNKSKMLFWVTFSDNTMIELNKNSPYSKIYDISIQSSNNSVVNIVNNELNFINPGKSNIVINIYTKRICEFSNSLYKKFSSLKTISPNKNRKTKFQLKNDQSPSINLNENQKKFSILIFQNNSHIYLINENVGSVDLDSPKELIFSVKSWNRNFDQVDIEKSFSGQNVLTNMISSQKNNKINQEVSFVKSNMGRIVIYSLVCIFLLVSCVFSIYIILLIIHHCKKIKLNRFFIFKNCETPQYNKHDNYFNSTKRYNKSFLTNSINLPNIKSSYPHVPSQSAHTVKYSNYKCKPNTTDSGFSTNQNVSQKETIRKMNRWIKKNYFIENTNFSHYPSIDFNTQYDVYNK
ncbi:hypothetical protein A3Q56_06377 [Intoshia linei]|uniref:Uncharacterized protein n=1 Tax=Intoshia linei TaxID=1819745 RepID=A0A177AVN7_9BILA|nr:hypothetical protein A3Q56_06377 [Intoshia linei]